MMLIFLGTFRTFPIRVNWREAKEMCASFGGALAIFTTQDELNTLIDEATG